MEDKAYVHLYTGNGKGKTTAAFGLALRAACAGKNVYIGQFVKGMKYSETKVTDYIENIVIDQYGRDCFIEKEPEDLDYKRASEGLEKVSQILKSETYDLVILDEINIALYLKLIDIDDLLKVLDSRRPGIEVVLTGRYASDRLIDYADLVTEMKEIKHYYQQGVEARPGIEC